MSPKFTEKNINLISINQAISLVPYTRDYLSRIAREGKISAAQVDKVWYFDKNSLVNFFEFNQLEDVARKRILSQSRKNDLEVKNFYKNSLSILAKKKQKTSLVSFVLTFLIVCSGVLSGLLFRESLLVLSSFNQSSFLANINFSDSALGSINNNAAVINSAFENRDAYEVTEKIPMDNGVVIFPSISTKEKFNIEELFSDDVTVVITGTTTGFVRGVDGTELPFVRVPDRPSS